MKRREFITLLGGAAAAWPLAARAQQRERMRRIGVLMHSLRTIRKRRPASWHSCRDCSEQGWTVGRNVRIDIRWAAGEPTLRRYAAELVALAPDVILGAVTTSCAGVAAGDPHHPDRVRGRHRPGRRRLRRKPGAAGRQRTGFIRSNIGLSAKWLELLKEFAPRITRVAVLRIPRQPAGSASLPPCRPRALPRGGVESRSMCTMPARSSATSLRSRASRMAA